MKEKYQQYLQTHTAKLKIQEKQSQWLGYIKLALVTALAVLLWFSYKDGFDRLKMVLLGTALLITVLCWVKHSHVCSQIRYLKGLIQVVKRYISRIDGSWAGFSDCGSEYVDYSHPYTFDLDIFGSKSMFQFLNVTNTYHGRRQFQRDLAQPEYSPAEIEKRQEAIRELSGLDEFSHDFQCYGSFMENMESIPKLMKNLKQSGAFLENEWVRLLLHYMPFLFTPVALGIFIFHFSSFYLTGAGLLAFQTVLGALFAYKTYQYLSFINKVKYGLNQYSMLYDLLEKQEFKSPLLKELQANISSSGCSAAAAMKKLDTIVSMVEVRRNVIFYIVFHVLFLWDIQCAFSLEKWKNKYAPYFDTWFTSLGELESLLSFSVIGNVTSGMVYPELTSKEKSVDARGIGHPLIPDETRICNDFQLEDDIVIISGSNMSGKTTFLRTIGLNLILAKCGCCVCADSMSFSNMKIITSMRISDDLNEGISTFYAELKKIKAIIQMAENNRNVIFFIDEIFRGTNSSDRTAGARAVIRRLYELRACGFLTTHDLTLCEATEGAQMSNWHFSEQYTNGELSFDYKIQPGIAKTTNGQYLMRMIGILH